MMPRPALLLAASIVLCGCAGRAAEPTVPPVPRFATKLGIEFVAIPGGAFLMGGPDVYVQPRHQVTLSPFYCARLAVTRRLLRQFAHETGFAVNRDELGPDPDGWKFESPEQWRKLPIPYRRCQSEDAAVGMQTCAVCDAFVEWFSKKEGRAFEIATEAQIEYLARSGIAHGDEDFWWQAQQPSAEGNWSADTGTPESAPSDSVIIPGLYTMTPWGIYLYPISYVCRDRWQDPYSAEAQTDPEGPHGFADGFRVHRGTCLFHRQRIFPKRFAGMLLLVTKVEDQDRHAPIAALAEAEPPAEPIESLPRLEVHLPNDTTLALRQIPAGKFIMGRPERERPWTQEWPEQPVAMQAYWLGETEVTQRQFRAVTGTNPSFVPGDDLPVHSVKMADMVAFCDLVTAQERAAGRLGPDEEYRLPMEAEWERAALAGKRTRYDFGDDVALLKWHAWYDDMTGPHPVATKQPNRWGFYDLEGNVMEVCGERNAQHWDVEENTNWHRLKTDDEHTFRRPGIERLFKDWFSARGGAWNMGAISCEPTLRRAINVLSGTYHIGFRLARGAIPPDWVGDTKRWRAEKRYLEIMKGVEARK